MSLAASKKYSGVLKGKVNISPYSQVLDEKVAADKELIVAQRSNINTYTDFILTWTGEVSSEIVEGSVTDDLPKGDAKLPKDNMKKNVWIYIE